MCTVFIEIYVCDDLLNLFYMVFSVSAKQFSTVEVRPEFFLPSLLFALW
jgi:hypothetical protein